MQLSAEYLQDVATLLKMTCYFEFKLEEQRIKMSLTPHFDPKIVYNKLAQPAGITKDSIKDLFGKFMSNLTDKELDYLFQLYSSDGETMAWEDFIQTITPNEMEYNESGKQHDNEQIVGDLFVQLHRFFKIEVQYYRQAEPIRMHLFEKYKESGKQFTALVQDHRQNLSFSTLLQFMKKQKFQFNTQDLFCLKKRILCNQNDEISADQFVRVCPLLPFQIMTSRNQNYRLIQQRARTPERRTTPECIQTPEIFPSDQIIPLPVSIKASSTRPAFVYQPNPPQRKTQQSKFEMTNYDFFMSDLKYKNQDLPPTQPQFYPQRNHQITVSPPVDDFAQTAQTTHLDKFMRNGKQERAKPRLYPNQSQQNLRTPHQQQNEDLIEQFIQQEPKKLNFQTLPQNQPQSNSQIRQPSLPTQADAQQRNENRISQFHSPVQGTSGNLTLLNLQSYQTTPANKGTVNQSMGRSSSKKKIFEDPDQVAMSQKALVASVRQKQEPETQSVGSQNRSKNYKPVTGENSIIQQLVGSQKQLAQQ